MQYRFNTPPGWPTAPEGWMPPPGWQPDPAWPAPPPNWEFWLPAADRGSDEVAPLRRESGPPQAETVGALSQPFTSTEPIPAVVGAGQGGFLGKRKRSETENEALRAEIARLKGMDPKEIAEEVAAATRGLSDLKRQQVAVLEVLSRAQAEAESLRSDIVQLRDEQLLQEVGIYEYRHRLEDAVAYKVRLEHLRERIKEAGRSGRAVLSTTDWRVNNSAAQGRKMVKEFSKLMLRAYNAEADSLVRDLRAFRVDAAVARLSKTRETIAKLGTTMNIRVSDAYHALRVEELELTADYLVKAEEEKERVREERERQREEAKAQREFEREKARLLKEQAHYHGALARLGDADERTVLEGKLAEIEAAIKGVEDREANIRAGYVYVISNFGSFGPDVIKIGLTRRLDPMERVRELGDASVPFRFDVHALVFSEDAVSLETALHHEFAESRLNRVNMRREFFRATPVQVRDALSRHVSHHLLEFTDTPEALEWRQSKNSQ